ncbi:MAG: DUF4157 domain-containing protein [Kofleriaceae bacterium]|nr:DUF4157 domain-containing protein [Kofleriaceae bacterium]
MSDTENQGVTADELTDDLAKKYDPDRLLKLFGKRAGKGEALDHSIRAKYEKRFGVDLGHVRIVTGEFAEEFNRKRDAYAVTVGSTGLILMGNSPDKSMGSAAGQALLAHELTHVAQAKQGLHRKGTYDGTMQFTEEHEAEAHAVEHDVEQHGHSEGQGASMDAAAAQKAAKAAEDQMKENIEKIKARVLEMMGESARVQYERNGLSRRP